MTERTLPLPPPVVPPLWRSIDPVLAAFVLALVGLAAWSGEEAMLSLDFVGRALWAIAPAFLLAIGLAAYAKASGADAQVARVFQGRESGMIVAAALMGALSPFCSCGVVPLIAGLLAAGVPVAPVMAFWLASPLMDPNMFVITAANLGLEFALAKTAAAVGVGLLGGFAAMALDRLGWIDGALRSDGRKVCGAAARRAMAPPPPVWAFWREPARRRAFAAEGRSTLWFLLRWMTLAFLLESLMVRHLPAEWIAGYLGGEGAGAIPLAVALGVPAYFNGFAAVPLVKGLVELGMSPAVGLAFLVAGGVTSIPAMIAVQALVRLRLFLAYLGLAGVGALLSGYGYAAWLALG